LEPTEGKKFKGYFESTNLTQLSNAIPSIPSGDLNLTLLPKTKKEFSILYDTKIANRKSYGYCASRVGDPDSDICPDITFYEFVKQLGIVGNK
jgi:hypothetical protein